MSSFKEFLAEASRPGTGAIQALTSADFKIEDIGEGKFKVKAIEPRGMPVKVITDLAFANMTSKNVQTLSGQVLDHNSMRTFKASGVLFIGDINKVKAALDKSIDAVNKEIKSLNYRKETAADRKKAAAKFSASKQKDRIAKLKEKLGIFA